MANTPRTKRIESILNARYAGQDAAASARNPYKPGSPEHDAWLQGFREVRDESTAVDKRMQDGGK